MDRSVQLASRVVYAVIGISCLAREVWLLPQERVKY